MAYDDMAGKIRAKFPLPPVIDDDTSMENEIARYENFALLPPRLAYVTASNLEVTADMFLDLLHPVDGGLYVSEDLPPIIGPRSWEWMSRMATSCLDLRDDIVERGIDPRPRSTAEEVMLWLAMGEVDEASVRDMFHDENSPFYEDMMSLDEHPEDFTIELVTSDLYEDLDFEMLYDPKFDGIEDVDNPINQMLGIGELLQPDHWFDWFWEPREARELYRVNG